jgi:hypothetical protein
LPVPAGPALAVAAGALPVGLGTPFAGVVPKSGAGGLPECAESRDWPTGPLMLNPAAIDSAAAATAPDAMKRLRPKKSLDAVTASGKTGRGGVSGIGCPNERDLKTSSKVACSFTSPHSGFDPPKTTLHNVRLLGRARTSRSASSEVEMPPLVKPYRGSLGVNTRNLESVGN